MQLQIPLFRHWFANILKIMNNFPPAPLQTMNESLCDSILLFFTLIIPLDHHISNRKCFSYNRGKKQLIWDAKEGEVLFLLTWLSVRSKSIWFFLQLYICNRYVQKASHSLLLSIHCSKQLTATWMCHARPSSMHTVCPIAHIQYMAVTFMACVWATKSVCFCGTNIYYMVNEM